MYLVKVLKIELVGDHVFNLVGKIELLGEEILY